MNTMSPSAAERKNLQEYSLHATNNSAIVTFGEHLLKLPWVFTYANTTYSILGEDFFFASFQSPHRHQTSPSISCLNTA